MGEKVDFSVVEFFRDCRNSIFLVRPNYSGKNYSIEPIIYKTIVFYSTQQGKA